MIKTVVALLSLAASASALTCYGGYASDLGSTPSNTLTGCSACVRTVSRYRYGSSESSLATYSGIGCTITATNSLWLYSGSVSSVGTSCSIAGLVTTTTNNIANAANNAANALNSLLSGNLNVNTLQNVATCQASSTNNICSGPTDSSIEGYCICCSDNCNSAGLRCGAAGIASFSLLGMLLFTVVGYFLRQ